MPTRPHLSCLLPCTFPDISFVLGCHGSPEITFHELRSTVSIQPQRLSILCMLHVGVKVCLNPHSA